VHAAASRRRCNAQRCVIAAARQRRDSCGELSQRHSGAHARPDAITPPAHPINAASVLAPSASQGALPASPPPCSSRSPARRDRSDTFDRQARPRRPPRGDHQGARPPLSPFPSFRLPVLSLTASQRRPPRGPSRSRRSPHSINDGFRPQRGRPSPGASPPPRLPVHSRALAQVTPGPSRIARRKTSMMRSWPRSTTAPASTLPSSVSSIWPRSRRTSKPSPL